MTGVYLKEFRSKKTFDAIFCSPLKRALDTANIIRNEIDFKDDIIILDDLREHKSGKLSGTTRGERLADHTFDNIMKLQAEQKNIKDPIEIMKYYLKIDDEAVKLGGESHKQGLMRAENVLNHILSTKYKKIIIVTHSGTISEMLHFITKYGGMESGTNCSICYIEYKDHDFEIITLPNTEHLNIV